MNTIIIIFVALSIGAFFYSAFKTSEKIKEKEERERKETKNKQLEAIVDIKFVPRKTTDLSTPEVPKKRYYKKKTPVVKKAPVKRTPKVSK